MRLNLTFFIQIINFGITYWFLNKFMFHPIIKLLDEKNKKQKKNEKLLQNQEQELLTLEKTKDQALINFKKLMNEKYKVKTLLEPKISAKIFCKIDKQEIIKLTDVAKKILIKRVPNVD